MRTGPLRTVDGDPPVTRRGCIAQAWSVAEARRAGLRVAAADPVGAAPTGRRGFQPA
jgi:hypothetical protein